MNILNRLKKIEANNLNKTPCFCNQTYVSLLWDGQDTVALTYCPNCKDTFDAWANLVAEAQNGENLTDEVAE
jgi:hypothetical protein